MKSRQLRTFVRFVLVPKKMRLVVVRRNGLRTFHSQGYLCLGTKTKNQEVDFFARSTFVILGRHLRKLSRSKDMKGERDKQVSEIGAYAYVGCSFFSIAKPVDMFQSFCP